MEKQNIEYKREWKDEYLKWICGFANANGGKVFIGIDDDGFIHPLTNQKKLLEDLPNKIVNLLGILAEVNLLGDEPDTYIEIIVNPSEVPVSYKGSYHYRSGSTKQELKGTALTQFLIKKSGKSWDNMICENAGLEDIDPEAIKYFISKAKHKKRIADNIERDSLSTLLENLDLKEEGGRIKMLRFYYLGKNLCAFFPRSSLKLDVLLMVMMICVFRMLLKAIFWR